MMMVISKYTKFPNKKRTTMSMWFSFFGWNGFCIVRLEMQKHAYKCALFLFLNNPETLGCVVKAWMIQMAVKGYRQVPYHILYMRAYRNTREKCRKTQEKNNTKSGGFCILDMKNWF